MESKGERVGKGCAEGWALNEVVYTRRGYRYALPRGSVLSGVHNKFKLL